MRGAHGNSRMTARHVFNSNEPMRWASANSLTNLTGFHWSSTTYNNNYILFTINRNSFEKWQPMDIIKIFERLQMHCRIRINRMIIIIAGWSNEMHMHIEIRMFFVCILREAAVRNKETRSKKCITIKRIQNELHSGMNDIMIEYGVENVGMHRAHNGYRNGHGSSIFVYNWFSHVGSNYCCSLSIPQKYDIYFSES